MVTHKDDALSIRNLETEEGIGALQMYFIASLTFYIK